MSVEYTVLECSQAAKVSGDNASWTNCVHRTGIDLLPGDQIGLEMCALHQQGSNGDTVEITGEQTDADVQDNKAILDFDFYINHCGRATARLPFVNSRTYQGSNPANTVSLLNLRCRRLGLPDLEHCRLNPLPGYNFSVEMPDHQYVSRVELTSSGALVYNAGVEYELRPYVLQSTAADGTMAYNAITYSAEDTLMHIEVNTTRTVPSVGKHDNGGLEKDDGIETFSVTRLGNHDYGVRTAPATTFAFLPSTAQAPFAQIAIKGPTPGNLALFTVTTNPNPNFYSRNNRPPDGERYFPSQIAWNGPGVVDDPAYDLRSQFCSIIIEPSVYQPDTLCESITSDMQSRQAAADFNLPFVDLNQYDYNGDTSKPFITETGCYNACSVNFAGLVPGGTPPSAQPDETAATFRRKYWTNLAVKDPRAWSLSVLRNLNEDQVSSGTFDVLPSGDDGGDRGDWGEIPVLLTNFPVHGNPDIINAWPQLGLIITSIKFTAETCKIVGAAFKTAEEFRGSSLPINPLDYDVCLDLGLYSDQHSDVTDTLATGTGRQRFKSVSEVRANPTSNVLRVDVGPTVCLDRDGNPGNALLPQLWVKSRWSDGYSVDDPGMLANYDSARNANHTDLLFRMSPNGSDLNNFKQAGYEALLAVAKANDLAAVPVWPQQYTLVNGAFVLNPDYAQAPFMAFFSADQLGPGHVQIDAHNSGSGIQIGFDASFIRHEVVSMHNLGMPDKTNKGFSATDTQPLIGLGATNPTIEFNPDLARCQFTYLHTPFTISNGTQIQSPDQQTATGDPETESFGVTMSNQAIQGAIFKRMTSGVAGSIEKALNFDPIKDSTMHGKVLDSQSGVCLKGIRVKQAGTYVQMTPENEKDSLFHKLGFNIADLVRDLGSVQGGIGQAHLPYTLAQERAYPRPITTCAFVGAAEFQSLSLNRAGMPLYDLGYPTGGGQPQVQSAGIVAQRPPSKLQDGYVLIFSDLMTSCSTRYYGGLSNTDLPCAALVSRVDSSGDYTFADQSGWQFTVQKATTLTTIMVDIRRPNGMRVSLKDGSLIIFKITREIEPASTSAK